MRGARAKTFRRICRWKYGSSGLRPESREYRDYDGVIVNVGPRREYQKMKKEKP